MSSNGYLANPTVGSGLQLNETILPMLIADGDSTTVGKIMCASFSGNPTVGGDTLLSEGPPANPYIGGVIRDVTANEVACGWLCIALEVGSAGDIVKCLFRGFYGDTTNITDSSTDDLGAAYYTADGGSVSYGRGEPLVAGLSAGVGFLVNADDNNTVNAKCIARAAKARATDGGGATASTGTIPVFFNGIEGFGAIND